MVETLKKEIEILQNKHDELYAKYEKSTEAESNFLNKEAELVNQLREKEAYIKIIVIKMEDYEKKYEHMIKKYE